MSPLTQHVVDLLNDPSAFKVLATVDEHGVPHSAVPEAIVADEEGNLRFLELVESSRTQKNLVRSTWFDRKVSIFVTKGEEAFQVIGVPIRLHVSGPEFQKRYVEIRNRRGDIDLAGVWIVRPDLVSDESLASRVAAHEAAHPSVIHLDRIAKA